MFNSFLLYLFLSFFPKNVNGIIRRHHRTTDTPCSIFTCGKDCMGNCGWSSFWNRCMKGYTTSEHEMNYGIGCTTTPPTKTSFEIYIINVTHHTITSPPMTSSTMTSSAMTSSAMTSSPITSPPMTSPPMTSSPMTSSPMTSSTMTSSTIISQSIGQAFTNITNLINQNNEIQSPQSYGYIAGIVFILLLMLFFILQRSKRRNTNNVIINDNTNNTNNVIINDNTNNTIFDDIYEEPMNSIMPYSVSRDIDTFYEEPLEYGESLEYNESLEYEEPLEYDDKIRALENKKYEM